MIEIRPFESLGKADHGWLEANFHFSFAEYQDHRRLNWGKLRVWNDDIIAPHSGFPPHPHQDMEIITYVLEGSLAHKDSTGGGGVITPGMVQYMSAGTGVTHSEFNASDEEPLHLYQIWLLPNKRGAAPRYEERRIGDARNGRLKLVASADGRDESFQIRQDADLYAAAVKEGESLEHAFGAGRYGWLQVARGGIELPEGSIMQAGDGAKIEDETRLSFKALADSEILLFDLA